MLPMRWRGCLLLLAVLFGWFGSTAAAHAEVKLHPLFTDGCVLQEGKASLFGSATPGEKLTISFADKAVMPLSVQADNQGNWQASLPPLGSPGPHRLTIIDAAGKQTLLNDVLIGEVWIASGQSNMEWPLQKTENAAAAIAASTNPQLRLFTVPKLPSKQPVATVNGKWVAASPATTASFSAVGYYFGRDLQRVLGKPVGIIHASWGGTIAEAWISLDSLEATAKLKPLVLRRQAQFEQYDAAAQKYLNDLERYVAAARKLPPGSLLPPGPGEPKFGPNIPTVLYNGMIHPIARYPVRGAIWYQGESNAGRAEQYLTIMPTLIADWRKQLNHPDLAFYIVQLAPFMKKSAQPQASAWAELREAQRLTTLRVPKTGLAVITDAGDEDDIHPQKKEPVGARLALQALRKTYGKDVVADGPMFKSLRIEGNKAIVSFDSVAGGLVAKGGPLTGFTLAGKDGVFHNATATIVGETVVVTCEQVPEPVAVRYGWANYPVVNLYNQAGLPASPFRTDDFPLITAGKE
jgi:sialate O-acetylesterase